MPFWNLPKNNFAQDIHDLNFLRIWRRMTLWPSSCVHNPSSVVKSIPKAAVNHWKKVWKGEYVTSPPLLALICRPNKKPWLEKPYFKIDTFWGSKKRGQRP